MEGCAPWTIVAARNEQIDTLPTVIPFCAVASAKDADGNGYVQEIKLPWKLITNQKHYQAGDTFNMGVELLWGEGDWPVHRYADNMAEGYTSREFFFTNVPAWGPVILESKGNLHLPEPAYLKATQTQEAQGPVEVTYNLPEDGQPSAQMKSEASTKPCLRNI